MIKAFQLILSPFEAWEKIAMAERGFWWSLLAHLLPLAAVAVAIEAFCLAEWGQSAGEFSFRRHVPAALAVRYGVAYLLLLLGGALLSANFLKWASQSFNVKATYTQCFTVTAYGFSPIVLARILDGVPQINTWLCWAIGAATAASVLYHGVGMVLRPEQTKGFGLYLVAIVLVVIASALAHFAAVAVLQG